MATFRKATKQQAKLRMALIGPSGSGKTYTALKIATQLGDRVAVIDTERGSASKYADKFEFDVLELDSFHPQRYIEGIQAAEAEGYDVLIIDSLSHAWAGKDGALELVDKAAKRMQSSNTFAAWRDVTPLHNALVDAMLQSRLHLIVTMRAKTEYIVEKDERTGKSVPRKVGLAPVQRDGVEYEFDVVADMDLDNTLIVSKSRCEALNGAVIAKPGKEVADTLKAWLTDGAPEAAQHGKAATMEVPKAETTPDNGAPKRQMQEQPSGGNGGNVQRAYFAVATNALGVKPEVAKEYAKWFASQFMKREISSFKDIPPAVLKEAVKHIESTDSRQLYEEVQALRARDMQPNPVPGYEQEAFV